MPTEWKFVTAAIVLGLILGVRVAVKAWRRRPELADYYGDERMPAPLPRYSVPELHEDTGRLPTVEERTELLSALRDVCQYCGLDHVGDCRPSQPLSLTSGPVQSRHDSYTSHDGPAVPAVDDYITGEIVRITDAVDDWHFSLGQWVAPAWVYERLDGDDWLRALLVSA